jgi:hypothetical protein
MADKELISVLSRPQSRLLDGIRRRVLVWHSAGLTGVIEKNQIAYVTLLMLREIGFIPNRGNCRVAQNAN